MLYEVITTMLLISVSTIFFFDSAQGSHKIMGSIVMLAATTATLAIFIFNKKIVDMLCQLHIPLLPAIFIEKIKEIYRAMYRITSYNVCYTKLLRLGFQIIFDFPGKLLKKIYFQSINFLVFSSQ